MFHIFAISYLWKETFSVKKLSVLYPVLFLPSFAKQISYASSQPTTKMSENSKGNTYMHFGDTRTLLFLTSENLNNILPIYG